MDWKRGVNKLYRQQPHLLQPAAYGVNYVSKPLKGLYADEHVQRKLVEYLYKNLSPPPPPPTA
jgi:hypothetical protein